MLEAPVSGPVSKPAGTRRASGAPKLRRDLSEDFASPRSGRGAFAGLDTDTEVDGQDGYGYRPQRFSGLKFRLRGGVPRRGVGRVMVGLAGLIGIVGFTAGLWEARAMLLENPRLVVPSSSAIQITGNEHLTRAQLLVVFGGDVDRNILTVPLTERKAELERLPWVEHATVMRLMPNKFRVAITERTPVAFVRQGSAIGLVDAHGVLLDMASDGDSATKESYSFPVVTGISQDDPLSTRAARMKLFMRFMSELDDAGAKVSQNLSEVDLSNPEDVKALIPQGSSAILVHFGEDDFRHRYDLFEKNLPEWMTQHPKLAAADMRYEHQVVLEMAPGAAVASESAAKGTDEPVSVASKVAVKRPVKAAVKPVKVVAKKPVLKPAGVAAPVPGHHLENSFDVKPKTGQVGQP